MIEWINPKDRLPRDGEMVALLRYHWKECWPLSADIIFGEAEIVTDEYGRLHARVNTWDFTGSGCSSYYFLPNSRTSEDYIAAWCCANEFKKPDFLNHKPHWGKLKE